MKMKIVTGKNRHRILKLLVILLLLFAFFHLLNKILSFHLVVNSVIYFTNEAEPVKSFQSLESSHHESLKANRRHAASHESKSSHESDLKVSNPGCKSKKQHIMFLKTHKCGSSTLQNVFLRFGDTNNLYFVLPMHMNYLGHPSRFNRRLILEPLILKRRFNLSYSILTHHTRFAYKELNYVLPPDTAFVTILRDPVTLFESMYSYFDLGLHWPGISNNTNFDTFLEFINQQENYTHSNSPTRVPNGATSHVSLSNITSNKIISHSKDQESNSWSISNLLNKISPKEDVSSISGSRKKGQSIKKKNIDLNFRFGGRFGRNQMSFDLGFNERFFNAPNIVSNFVQAIDSIFSIVLISERMDESLILLRHLLCWPLEDVIVFRHNSRLESKKKNKVLSQDQKMILRKFNSADNALYQHFVKKFDESIRTFGVERMKQEVLELKNLTKFWMDKCVDSFRPMKEVVPSTYWSSDKVDAIKMKNVTNPDSEMICSQLTMSEMVFTEKLRKKQQLILRNRKLGFNTDFKAFQDGYDPNLGGSKFT